MTNQTKPCEACNGEGTISRPYVAPHLFTVSMCGTCDGIGRVPVLESHLEAVGQERLPLDGEGRQ